MYCTKCGRENPNDAKFCFHCGAPLIKKDITNKIESEVPRDLNENGQEYDKEKNQDKSINIVDQAIKPDLKNLMIWSKWNILICIVVFVFGGYLIFHYFSGTHRVLHFTNTEDSKKIFSKIDNVLNNKEIENEGEDNEYTTKYNDDKSIESYIYKVPDPSVGTTYYFNPNDHGNTTKIELHDINDSYYMDIYYFPEENTSVLYYLIGIDLDKNDKLIFKIFTIKETEMPNGANFAVAFNKNGELNTQEFENMRFTYPGLGENEYDRMIVELNNLLKPANISMDDFINTEDLKYFVCSYNDAASAKSTAITSTTIESSADTTQSEKTNKTAMFSPTPQSIAHTVNDWPIVLLGDFSLNTSVVYSLNDMYDAGFTLAEYELPAYPGYPYKIETVFDTAQSLVDYLVEGRNFYGTWRVALLKDGEIIGFVYIKENQINNQNGADTDTIETDYQFIKDYVNSFSIDDINGFSEDPLAFYKKLMQHAYGWDSVEFDFPKNTVTVNGETHDCFDEYYGCKINYQNFNGDEYLYSFNNYSVQKNNGQSQYVNLEFDQTSYRNTMKYTVHRADGTYTQITIDTTDGIYVYSSK